jgi:hypothetical protein
MSRRVEDFPREVYEQRQSVGYKKSELHRSMDMKNLIEGLSEE